MTEKKNSAGGHRIWLEYEIGSALPMVAATIKNASEKDDYVELAFLLADATDMLNVMAHRAVAVARAEGATWDAIGVRFGITRQAAQQRFKAAADMPAM